MTINKSFATTIAASVIAGLVVAVLSRRFLKPTSDETKGKLT